MVSPGFLGAAVRTTPVVSVQLVTDEPVSPNLLAHFSDLAYQLRGRGALPPSLLWALDPVACPFVLPLHPPYSILTLKLSLRQHLSTFRPLDESRFFAAPVSFHHQNTLHWQLALVYPYHT